MPPEIHDQQIARERQAVIRARDDGASNARRLKEMGRASSLTSGQRLYQATIEGLTASIAKALEEYVVDPKKAAAHAAAMPYLNDYSSPAHIAAVALTATINNLGRRARLATFAQNIGSAMEMEHRLIRLAAAKPQELRHFKKEGLSKRTLASREVMGELGCHVAAWDNAARLQVGLFLHTHLEGTGLIRTVRRKVGRSSPRFVYATEDAEAFIRACPQRERKAVGQAMLCRPRPWTGLFGGGQLTNEDCLVKVPIQDLEVKNTTGIDHLRKVDLTRIYAAVNHLQSQKLTVDAEMVSLQRIAWEAGIEGLFPCSRAPLELPERLAGDYSEDDFRLHKQIAAQIHRDRERNRPARLRIERSIQAAEELAGRSIWQAMHLDHRGRIYTGNRYVTNQGSDQEKAALSFEGQHPIGPDGMAWLLKAAAGHYGLTRSSWREREDWGDAHLQQMLAAAEDPLSNMELWRSAKDPWQFLQTCRGIKEAIDTSHTSAPIRLDQTTSGCGILSALIRDREVGRLCNLWGSTPRDLYTVIADKVVASLKQDLEGPIACKRVDAELWLGIGVNRSLLKGPVLATPYGGSYMSLADNFVDYLADARGYVPLEEFGFLVAKPAKYLASHAWVAIKDTIGNQMAVKKWLMVCCRKVLGSNQPMQWISPMGFPIRAAERDQKVKKVMTQLFGKKISVNIASQPLDAPYSATMANKSLGANFVHGFDAAFLQAIAYGCGERGIPLLTNHDCFATTAGWATTLHQDLHLQMRSIYATDWLLMAHTVFQQESGLELPLPPLVNTLEPAEIGTNPYLFS